jgi:hypothetical protein
MIHGLGSDYTGRDGGGGGGVKINDMTHSPNPSRSNFCCSMYEGEESYKLHPLYIIPN